MFKSLTYKDYDRKTDQYLYDLEDSEFGMVEVEVEDVGAAVLALAGAAVLARAVAREYSKRGLDVGKNIAVYTMWICETYGYTIENTCKNQDKYCSKYIPNWKEYASSRDEHLSKLLLIG